MVEKVELKVTGMSCGHCEMSVKKALKALDGVSSAEADRQAQKAVVQADLGRVTREALIAAVRKAGYEAS
ncbi:MAG: heavy-metal-associated domain-containing protein [Thermodesulfobacteriota bacterium]